jgi:tRNA 2-thiouridine synthesizing protein A
MTETEIVQAMPEVLDTRGLMCPYPYIQARKALESLPPGSHLEILTDSEPTAVSSIPILCEQNGYSFTRAKEGELWRLDVRKP